MIKIAIKTCIINLFRVLQTFKLLISVRSNFKFMFDHIAVFPFQKRASPFNLISLSPLGGTWHRGLDRPITFRTLISKAGGFYNGTVFRYEMGIPFWWSVSEHSRTISRRMPTSTLIFQLRRTLLSHLKESSRAKCTTKNM